MARISYDDQTAAAYKAVREVPNFAVLAQAAARHGITILAPPPQP